jgi:DNA-directed RNA polymerase subunit RPC12/RpoP
MIKLRCNKCEREVETTQEEINSQTGPHGENPGCKECGSTFSETYNDERNRVCAECKRVYKEDVELNLFPRMKIFICNGCIKEIFKEETTGNL